MFAGANTFHYQEHEATCPERLNIELYMLKKLNEKPKESAPSSFVIEDFDEENWDNNVSDYQLN